MSRLSKLGTLILQNYNGHHLALILLFLGAFAIAKNIFTYYLKEITYVVRLSQN